MALPLFCTRAIEDISSMVTVRNVFRQITGYGVENGLKEGKIRGKETQLEVSKIIHVRKLFENSLIFIQVLVLGRKCI